MMMQVEVDQMDDRLRVRYFEPRSDLYRGNCMCCGDSGASATPYFTSFRAAIEYLLGNEKSVFTPPEFPMLEQNESRWLETRRIRVNPPAHHKNLFKLSRDNGSGLMAVENPRIYVSGWGNILGNGY